MNTEEMELIFEEKISSLASSDPAHDLLHFKRVARTAKSLCAIENARMEIVVPAAWLHDLVIVPKNDPRRKEASRLSAISAVQFLKEIGYPASCSKDIAHAIEAHSYSANISPTTVEAKIVQDADRLDGLGAIGIARCFATSGLLNRPFYSEEDPLCEARSPDDGLFTVDHFFAKLFKVASSLQTESGRKEGARRVEFMKNYIDHLKREISGLM